MEQFLPKETHKRQTLQDAILEKIKERRTEVMSGIFRIVFSKPKACLLILCTFQSWMLILLSVTFTYCINLVEAGIQSPSCLDDQVIGVYKE